MLSTAQKVALARVTSRAVRLGRRLVGGGPELVTSRQGLTWQLDLREGIDLSIYLLGRFEPSTVRCYTRLVNPGDVVLDVGANIGAHTLPLARLVGEAGRVIAFEPTRYAFLKLQQNVSLNSALAARVSLAQVMLVSHSSAALEPTVYSSWPLEGSDEVHAKHRGRLMDTRGAIAATLDEQMRRFSIGRVNFIKLDVDGHERQVLDGARETLHRDRPPILLELAPYVFSDRPDDFDAMLSLLAKLGYLLWRVDNGAAVPADPDRLRELIPSGAGINVIATTGPMQREPREIR